MAIGASARRVACGEGGGQCGIGIVCRTFGPRTKAQTEGMKQGVFGGIRIAEGAGMAGEVCRPALPRRPARPFRRRGADISLVVIDSTANVTANRASVSDTLPS